ncbi:MAG: ATP-dependent DNA helicase RecG [Eubacterium sp.]|nr:ATP-dependent DNA helicase RecG [Eubacterium sp.]
MHTPLTDIKGVGPKTAELFRKMNISSKEELLHMFPRDYDAYEPAVGPGEVTVGQKNAVLARIRNKPSVKRFGSQSITMVYLEDHSGRLQVNWFHMPYLRNMISIGKDYVFRGQVIEKNGRRIMQHPELLSPEEYRTLEGQLLPVYPLTGGLSNKTVRKIMRTILRETGTIPEILPVSVLADYSLIGRSESLHRIHFPKSRNDLLQARHRLVFDEFFFFQIAVSRLRLSLQQEPDRFPMHSFLLSEEVIRNLPYALTDAQKQVWNDIQKDLQGKILMHRLVQGDVGSGKTILAFLAMLTAFENGYQSALMAPTEVLAGQHYQALNAILEKNGIRDAAPVLLRGSCTAAEKRKLREEISSGKARLVIGTHALIQDAIDFESLGLVITDEQHRFGVQQREDLQKKGLSPHVLVMSATPIPRTLARILYGDLDISLIKEMPARRLPIKNCVVDTSYRETAWKFIEKETAKGHQVYVVCPMIDPNEELHCENVKEYYEILKQRMGSTTAIGMLHGQMKAGEKQAVMDAFADGNIQVLVSTTVIEVGIDVANATVMMIENAERFGLAQLHQLRGRVGRGEAQSYCIFIQGDGKQDTSQRLDILNHSNDGFEIAEADLKLRGPGDLFGIRQSGMAVFQIADIYRDADILYEADQAAKDLLRKDPDLNMTENREIKNIISKLAYYRQKDYDV